MSRSPDSPRHERFPETWGALTAIYEKILASPINFKRLSDEDIRNRSMEVRFAREEREIVEFMNTRDYIVATLQDPQVGAKTLGDAVKIMLKLKKDFKAKGPLGGRTILENVLDDIVRLWIHDKRNREYVRWLLKYTDYKEHLIRGGMGTPAREPLVIDLALQFLTRKDFGVLAIRFLEQAKARIKNRNMPKITRNQDYWKPENLAALNEAHSFEELAIVALEVASRMPQPVGQVCGPISTGGVGSLTGNLQIFDKTIQQLIDEGKTIFDQMPFEDHFFRIIQEEWGTRHNNQLLTDFYLPILESGHIKTLHFIPGWESSHGATWEHAQAQRLGMKIVYL